MTFAVNPAAWPAAPASKRDDHIEQRLRAILSALSLEEKVGQIIQADIGSITPDEARDYHLGSILNGGNSAPGGDNRASPQAYLDIVQAFYEASVDKRDGRSGIPILWGTDAVHGHNNIVGATIFPHNIGLGATRNPELIRRIGAATAREVRATGMDWTFAPTLAVAREDRWGRTYESYSEDPEIVAFYARAMVEGLQGEPGTANFLSEMKTLATAKHFVGDGGTIGGIDQGDCKISEAAMRDIHAAGYPPAIAAGVQTVMASFNSWHGRKMHGVREMLNDVLVERMGFDGFVIGDWNGHGQVEGCTTTSAAAVFNAGLDMFMAPDSWKGLYENTLADVKAGRISQDRLDEAVSRILRVKLRLGLFDGPHPKGRALAGDFSVLGCADHRAIAREAVRKSQVLLKNDGVLPVHPASHVLVCGPGADDIGMQCGGWTVSWQGTGNSNEDFPGGQSVYDAIEQAVRDGGGSAECSVGGQYRQRPDVAFVVFGETPYAEFQGDRASVDFTSNAPLELMQRLRDEGIPVVSVFLSGRPLWVNPEINASNAFVASFLPGTEAGGIADLLIADHKGNARHDFSGRLSFSWPRSPQQTPLNRHDDDYDPQFAYGYGLSVHDRHKPELLDESLLQELRGDQRLGDLFIAGSARGPWQLAGAGQGDPVSAEARDHKAQEDTLVLTWQGEAEALLGGAAQDFSRELNAQMALLVSCRVLTPSTGAVLLGLRDAENRYMSHDVSTLLTAAADWTTLALPLALLKGEQEFDWSAVIQPFGIAADAPFSLQIADVRIAAWEPSATQSETSSASRTDDTMTDQIQNEPAK